jgi:hypothetical protein
MSLFSKPDQLTPPDLPDKPDNPPVFGADSQPAGQRQRAKAASSAFAPTFLGNLGNPTNTGQKTLLGT